jgi:hypothetical protein
MGGKTELSRAHGCLEFIVLSSKLIALDHPIPPLNPGSSTELVGAFCQIGT